MNEPAPGARLLLVILAVTDAARARRFYDAAFAWPVELEFPGGVSYRTAQGSGVMLYGREGFAGNTGVAPAAPPAQGTTATELYLHVDDLGAAIARLEAAGARLLSPRAPRSWGDDAAYYADPDGNVLALAAPSA